MFLVIAFMISLKETADSVSVPPRWFTNGCRLVFGF